MADITDRLITRLELQGESGVISGMLRYVAVQRELNALMTSLSTGVGVIPPNALLQVEKLEAEMTQLTGTMIAMAEVAAVAIGVALVGALGKAALEAEKLNARLTGQYGAKNAGTAESFIENFADRTNSNLEDARNAFLQMGIEGVQPTTKRMEDLVKLAKESGHTLTETVKPYTEALLKGGNSLQEFGIRLRDISSKGGGQSGTVTAIEQALQGITPQFEGLTAATNRLGTQWRELKDILGEIASGPLAKIAALFSVMADQSLTLLRLLKTLDDARNFNFKAFPDDLKKLFGLGGNEAPDLKNKSLGQWNPMLEITRQVVGALGPIGRIGIKASEIPGVQARRLPPITIKVEGDDPKRWLENGVRQAIEQLIQHGALSPGPQTGMNPT